MRILVVEDEPAMAEALVEVLREAHYAVDPAADGRQADELMSFNTYDLVVLDWSIPGPSGIELIQRWRRRGTQAPILMLTGRTDLDDRVAALDTGADDYLPKPFSFEELLARVRSLLRRRVRPLQGPLIAGDLEMDRAARQVRLGGEVLELSPREFALLEYLLRRKDEVVTRAEIGEHVWDASYDDVMSNTIDVIIHRLRKKIDGAENAIEGKLLHTVKGVGYTLRGERC